MSKIKNKKRGSIETRCGVRKSEEAEYEIPKKQRGRPKKSEEEKAKKNDYIECDICGNGMKFQRSNRTHHYKTRVHQANLRLLNLLKTARIKESKNKPMSLTELRAWNYGKKIIKNLEEPINDGSNNNESNSESDDDLDDIIEV